MSIDHHGSEQSINLRDGYTPKEASKLGFFVHCHIRMFWGNVPLAVLMSLVHHFQDISC
jgi:hypothetical protein